MCRSSVCIQAEPFDPALALHALRCNERGELDPSVGAVASFIGLVREFNEGDDVQALELEHYPGMTEKTIQDILEQAAKRWPLNVIHVTHRVGPLVPTDLIVWVGAASAHREAALQACAFVMDFLKTNAPFWKKERKMDGQLRWVSDRASDYLAADRWKA
ncbi:MAG: molybdenum cofactor biosynthesis protein MoaE [Bordetella sp.]